MITRGSIIVLALNVSYSLLAMSQTTQFNIVKGKVTSSGLPSVPIARAKVWYTRLTSPIDIGTQYSSVDGAFTLKVTKDRQLQTIQVAAAAHGYEPWYNPKQVNFKLKSELDVLLDLRPIDHKAKAVENLRSQKPEFATPKISSPAVPKTSNKAKPEERKRTGPIDPPPTLLPNMEMFVQEALESNASKLDITLRIEIVGSYIQRQQESGADLVSIPNNASKPKLSEHQLYQMAMKAIVNGEDEEAMGTLSELLSRSIAPRLRLRALVELADLQIRKNQPHNAMNHLNEALQIMKNSESGYGELLPYCHYKLSVAANATLADLSGLSSISLHRADSIMKNDSRHFRTASPRHKKLWHLIQLEKTRHAVSKWEAENKRKFRRRGVKLNKTALRSLNEAYPKEDNAYKGILVVEHASLMQRLRKPRKAVKLYKRASEINEDIYDSEFHPDMIKSSLGAAMSYSDMGKSNKALEHLVKARTMAICTYPEFNPLLAKLYYLEALNRQQVLPKSIPIVPVELMEGQILRLSELDSLYIRALRGAEYTLANKPDSLVRSQMLQLRMHALLGLISARCSEYQFRIIKNRDILAIWKESDGNAQSDDMLKRIKLLEGKPTYENPCKVAIEYVKQNQKYTDSLIQVLQGQVISNAKELSIRINNHHYKSRFIIPEHKMLGELLAESYYYSDWLRLFGTNKTGVADRALYREGQKMNRKVYIEFIDQVDNPDVSHKFRIKLLPLADKLMHGPNVPAEFNILNFFFHPNGELPISAFRK